MVGDLIFLKFMFKIPTLGERYVVKYREMTPRRGIICSNARKWPFSHFIRQYLLKPNVIFIKKVCFKIN